MNIFLLLFLLIILLYLKWLVIFITFPWVCLLFYFKVHKGLVWKLLAIPGAALEIITKEGLSRFIILNIGYIPSLTIRRQLYRMLGADIKRHAVIHYRTEIRNPFYLVIGKGSIIGDNVLLDARHHISIGANVNLSSNVSIYTEQHDYRDELFRSTDRGGDKAVVIGDRVWIGSNVVVLPGVTIGEGAVCCAGCVVTKDVEPYSVVAGIPAKKIATRPQTLKYEFDGSSCWFY
jgi:acetyltransferase-like isoleucine patch superfamily enzyme